MSEAKANPNAGKTRKIKVVIPDAKKADKSSYTYLDVYDEYKRFILRRFTGITGSHEDGEDLTQDVFERLFIYWDRVDKNRIEAVLAVICHNVRYDWMSKRYNRPHLIAVDDILEYDCSDEGISNPFRALVNERSFDQIKEAISILDESQITAFNLYHVKGLKVTEIAKEMGINNNAVYTLLDSVKRLINEVCDKPTSFVGEQHG